MRNNSFKLFVIFCFILFLTVGYAVVNSVSLTISGTAGAITTDLDVFLNGQFFVDSSSAQVITDPDNGSKTVDFKINNMSLNEEVEIVYYIVNEEKDVSADVFVNSIINSNPTYFSVFASFGNDSVLCPDVGDAKSLHITVRMIKTPITSADSSATFGLEIGANPTYDSSRCPV